jgi:hypothetical protein
MSSDQRYSIVNKARKLAIEAQDRQRALAGPPDGTPSLSQLPGGPSLKIDPQTREVVCIYSGLFSSNGVMMILNPRNICSYNQRLVQFQGVWQMEHVEQLSVVTGWI